MKYKHNPKKLIAKNKKREEKLNDRREDFRKEYKGAADADRIKRIQSPQDLTLTYSIHQSEPITRNNHLIEVPEKL
jgi:hypothetical protein